MFSSVLLVALLVAFCQASSSEGDGENHNDISTKDGVWWSSRGQPFAAPAADGAEDLRQRSGGLMANTTLTASPYRLVDEYNSKNFWDKFDFIETDGTHPDPTSGFVAYQSRENAERLGLISSGSSSSSSRGIAKMKVDTETVYHGRNLSGLGRASVRIESLASYAEGLIVADFSHLPGRQCGIWPAFWTYAKQPVWPLGGEIDIYEQWNKHNFNRQTLHMNTTYSGNCTLTSSVNGPQDPAFTNYAYTTDCNVVYPQNEGCSTWDFEGPYGSPHGGVYAVELTSTTLKMWSFHPSQVPADLALAVGGNTIWNANDINTSAPDGGHLSHNSDHSNSVHNNSSLSSSSSSTGSSAPTTVHPDPSKWGPPGLMTSSLDGSCDVAATFKNQTIVLNLELCGSAIDGSEWVDACALQTGYNSCPRYVAENPKALEDYWFGIRSLKVYQRG